MNEVIEYNITEAALQNLRERFATHWDLSYPELSKGIAETRNLRMQIETRRKDLKAGALEWGRKVDGEAKRITEELLKIEQPMKEKKQILDDEKERVRMEKENAKRAAILAEQRRIDVIHQNIEACFGSSVLWALQNRSTVELAEIINTPIVIGDEFDEFKAKAEERRDFFLTQVAGLQAQKIAHEAEAEANRIEAERLREVQAEQNRVAQVERDRLDRERAELNRIEAERQAGARAEQAKIDAERAELNRQRLAAKAKAQAEKNLADRIWAEKLHKERTDQMRPEKERLELWAAELRQMHGPEMTSDEGRNVVVRVVDRLRLVVEVLVDEIRHLA